MGKIYASSGFLVYEGEVKNGKPYGEGKVYRADGFLHMEGLFGIKGFIKGKIYTESGGIRFQGRFKINRAYGPNYPEEGILYDFNGT